MRFMSAILNSDVRKTIEAWVTTMNIPEILYFALLLYEISIGVAMSTLLYCCLYKSIG